MYPWDTIKVLKRHLDLTRLCISTKNFLGRTGRDPLWMSYVTPGKEVKFYRVHRKNQFSRHYIFVRSKMVSRWSTDSRPSSDEGPERSTYVLIVALVSWRFLLKMINTDRFITLFKFKVHYRQSSVTFICWVKQTWFKFCLNGWHRVLYKVGPWKLKVLTRYIFNENLC